MTRSKGVGPPGQRKCSNLLSHQRVESVDVKRLRTERHGVLRAVRCVPCAVCRALKDVRPAHVTVDPWMMRLKVPLSGTNECTGKVSAEAVGTNRDEK